MRGASSQSGPAPDPNALRRDKDQGAWTTLPAHRDGPIPIWPLSRQTTREKSLWARAWTRPQAVMWEQMRQEEEVAVYIRQLSRSEHPKASAADRTLLIRMMEALGLSQPGLARNRWRIEGEQQAPQQRVASAGSSVKERFSVLDGTG